MASRQNFKLTGLQFENHNYEYVCAYSKLLPSSSRFTGVIAR